MNILHVHHVDLDCQAILRDKNRRIKMKSIAEI